MTSDNESTPLTKGGRLFLITLNFRHDFQRFLWVIKVFVIQYHFYHLSENLRIQDKHF